MTAPGLTFLSWIRTGIGRAATAAGAAPPLDSVPGAATLPVTVAVEGAGAAHLDAHLATPGDVVGLDPDQVIRAFPPPGSGGASPSLFPVLELDRPDLPWLFTPAPPQLETPTDLRRGVRPWLCLVVIPERALEPPTAARPLPMLKALDTELPDLSTAWLWAHAQITTTGAAGETLEGILAGEPARTLSRLMAPVRLRPWTAYLACVVPTFEAGRRAGLGLPVQPETTFASAWTRPVVGELGLPVQPETTLASASTRPAVGAAGSEVQLPVYHHWRFSTGEEDDFEALGSRIQSLASDLAGTEPIDVGHAGLGLPGPEPDGAPWLMELEGVLVGKDVAQGSWAEAPWGRRLSLALANRLASTAQELAPPTYGSAPVADPLTLPTWSQQLNFDPRYRVLAALGTRVIQRHQEQLVAAAWEQAAQLREANDLLLRVQLARAIGHSLMARRIGPSSLGAPMGDERLLQLSLPIHGQVRSGLRESVARAVARNSSLRAALAMPFRRVTRPSGPFARRLRGRRRPLPPPVTGLARAPADPARLAVAPPLHPVSGMVDLGALSPTESFRTITPERVRTKVFPWETADAPGDPGGGRGGAGPGGGRGGAGGPGTSPAPLPNNVNYGFMSDLVASKGGTGIVGGALDFEGVPQIAWSPPRSVPPVRVGSLDSRGPGESGASTYVDIRGRQGRLSFSVHRSGFTYGNARDLFTRCHYQWTPGYLFEPQEPKPMRLLGGSEAWQEASIPGVRVHGTTGETLAGGVPSPAVAVTDLGSGRLDCLFAWGGAGNTHLATGLGLSEAGEVTGGWSIHSLGPLGAPRSLAANGNTVFLLTDGAVHVIRLDLRITESGIGGGYGQRIMLVDLSRTSIDLAASFGTRDFGAVAAADFGGAAGSDLVLAHTAGWYRVGVDLLDATGARQWSWGPEIPLPLRGVDGLSLGVTSSAASTERTDAVERFRQAAEATQLRQARVLQLAVPPAPEPGVDTAALASEVRSAMDPDANAVETAGARITISANLDPATLTDPLQPLTSAPRFDIATYELLRELDQERLFPGASAFPDDTATALVLDDRAVEAFLVGLNHEMARELLWRRFPSHHATYFRRFWDRRTTAGAPLDDIAPIESWSEGSALGGHRLGDGPPGSLVLLVRAKLLRRIPDALVYAAPAKASGAGRTLDLSTRRLPIFGGRLDPDLAMFGFDLETSEARGTGPHDGWYFVFEEHPTGPRFGLDEPSAPAAFGRKPSSWRQLDWAGVVRSEAEYAALAWVDAGPTSPLHGVRLPDDARPTSPSHTFAFSAAHMAHITLQPPVRIAIHATRLLPGEPP